MNTYSRFLFWLTWLFVMAIGIMVIGAAHSVPDWCNVTPVEQPKYCEYKL